MLLITSHFWSVGWGRVFEFRGQANELLLVTWSKVWNGGEDTRRRFLSIYSEAKDETRRKENKYNYLVFIVNKVRQRDKNVQEYCLKNGRTNINTHPVAHLLDTPTLVITNGVQLMKFTVLSFCATAFLMRSVSNNKSSITDTHGGLFQLKKSMNFYFTLGK